MSYTNKGEVYSIWLNLKYDGGVVWALYLQVMKKLLKIVVGFNFSFVKIFACIYKLFII